MVLPGRNPGPRSQPEAQPGPEYRQSPVWGKRSPRGGQALILVAVEAGAGKGRVSTGRDGEWITLDVGDDGPGLAPEARDKLFQPFAGTARDGGTGLGLVIVRDIMRAHGGDVFLVDGEGTGATFRLKLPADRGDRS